MLLLVFVLGLAIVVGPRLTEPDTWAWVAQPGENQPPTEGADTQLARQPADDDSVIIRPNRAAEVPPGDKHYFPGFDPKLLAGLEDDAPLKPSEQPLRLELFALLRHTDPRALEEASLGEPAFIQLLKQPDSFRGQVVTIRGEVHGAFAVAAPPNDQGIRELLQLWIAPPGRSDFIVVDCLDLPKAFPRGRDLHEQVTLTGFFLKRLSYFSDVEQQIRVAPYVVAEQVEWTPHGQAAAARQARQPESLGKGLLGAVLLALVVFIALRMTVMRKGRSVNPYRPAENQGGGSHGFERLDELRNLEVSPEASEALRRIAEAEQPGHEKGQP